MKFRPCIDIHNGRVKQIVGGSLSDSNIHVDTNFVSEQDAAFYASLYKEDHIKGGHIILLNQSGTGYYNLDCKEAQKALAIYPNGLQIGGGITNQNAKQFLEMGASHVIITSFVFKDGILHQDNLSSVIQSVGSKRLVLDLSCRKKDGKFYIVTDRWQKFTNIYLTKDTLDTLAEYCDEFLIHAVDVEGKVSGIETELVELLGEWSGIPITYAGGVSSFSDLDKIKELGNNRLDVTIGSALDLFGGSMQYTKVLQRCTD